MHQDRDEIEKLHGRIVVLHQDIDVLRKPLVDIKSLISEIKKLLDLPDTIAKDLKKLRTVVSALNEITQLLEWVPGQLGTTCKAVHNLLSPLVAPESKGILDKMIKTTEEMGKLTSQVKQYLEKIEPLVDKALKAINSVRDDVIDLEKRVAELAEHYKRIPPSAETVECVHAVNGYIDQLDRVVLELKGEFKQAVQPLGEILNQIKNLLDPIAAIAQQITNALKQIDIKPINDLISQVNQYKKKIADFRKKVVSKIEAAVRAAFKKFGLDIDAIDKLISKIMDTALKPLRHFMDEVSCKLNGMLNQVASMLEKMLPIEQFTKIVSALESWRDTVERELDKMAGTACKSVLKA